MLDENMHLVSNSLETLEHLRGEKIKGVLDIVGNLSIIFVSGYSLQINSNGSYWVNSPKQTKKLLSGEFDRRKGLLENLKAVKDVISA